MKQFYETTTAAGVVLPKFLADVRGAQNGLASRLLHGSVACIAVKSLIERKPRTA